VIVVVAAALALSYTSTPMYRASTTLVYHTNTLDKTLFGAQVFSDTNQPRDVQTAADLVKLNEVAGAVKKQLGSGRSTGSLLGMISVTSSHDHEYHRHRRGEHRSNGGSRCRQCFRPTVHDPPAEHGQGYGRRGPPNSSRINSTG